MKSPTPAKPKPLPASRSTDKATTWVTSPQLSPTPKPDPVTASLGKSIAEEAANAARKKGEKRKVAPPPPKQSPAPQQAPPISSGVATIDKKVGEKIKIFEEKMRRKSTKRESPRPVTKKKAPERPPVVYQIYDDTVNGENEDLYDDATTPQDYDDAMAGGETYDDTMPEATYDEAFSATTDDIYDDTAVSVDDTYDDTAVSVDDTYDDTANDENALYEYMPENEPPTAVPEDTATPPEAPRKRLPRTPFNELPKEPTSKHGVEMRKRSKKQSHKRSTVPSGEYAAMKFDAENQEPDVRSRSDTEVNEVLGAFDNIISGHSGGY